MVFVYVLKIIKFVIFVGVDGKDNLKKNYKWKIKRWVFMIKVRDFEKDEIVDMMFIEIVIFKRWGEFEKFFI